MWLMKPLGESHRQMPTCNENAGVSEKITDMMRRSPTIHRPADTLADAVVVVA